MLNRAYNQGRNLEILHRSAEAQYEQLPGLAAELVRRGIAVLFVTGGGAAVLAAKAATTTIPIVFHLGTDPVALGLVESLSRPGGNITGITFLTTTLVAKRFALMREAVPTATSLAFLVNPTAPQAEAETGEAEAAAHALGVRLVILKAATQHEVDAAFAILEKQRVGGLVMASDPLFFTRLANLAASIGVPAMYSTRDIIDAGGFMSYGANFYESYRGAGNYVGRILKGERPADLAVQRSTKPELVINLKIARALGIEVPTSILLRADEVIE